MIIASSIKILFLVFSCVFVIFFFKDLYKFIFYNTGGNVYQVKYIYCCISIQQQSRPMDKCIYEVQWSLIIQVDNLYSIWQANSSSIKS